MDNTERDNKDAILKKIKKLMALAGSSNENEAKLASEKAQELMVRHQLSVQTIESANFDYEEDKLDDIGRFQKEHSLILSILNQHFFVRTYINREWAGYKNGKRQSKKSLQIVGTPTNVAVAKYIYEYLLHTYKRLWKTYKSENGVTESDKGAYFLGLTYGIKERLKEVKHKVETETGLVVIDDSGLVKRMKEMNLKSARGPSYNRNSEVEADGREHGKKVQIARALDNNSENKGLALAYNK